MRAFSSIFNIIAVVVFVLFFGYYLNVSYTIDLEFEQLRYEYAVKQATEAMFRSTLKAEDIGLDYVTMDYISIDSSEALEIFDRVMCFNYNMSPSEENFHTINESISACAIAGFDGFYITQMSEADTVKGNNSTVDDYSLRFSTKIPYYVQSNDKIYAIDTYKKTYASISTTDANANPSFNYDGNSLPAGITEKDLTNAINVQIRDRIINEINNSDNVALKDISGLRIYFPDQTTSTGVNPFSVPGIIMIMQGSEFSKTEGLTAMAVSGYKIVPKNNVVVFTDTRTNRSYYCYENQLKDEEKTADSGGLAIGGTYGPFKIENYYDSIQEACKEISPTTNLRYVPYYDIMVRKII